MSHANVGVSETRNLEADLCSAGDACSVEKALLRKIIGISAAAHELKTPLSILSGYTQLLLDGSLGELNAQQRGVVAEMDASTVRLLRFVNDFLAFGAIESGKLVPNRTPNDLNRIIGEVVQLWRPRLDSVGNRLEFLAAPELPPVLCDELKVQHIISNLLDNACKFTPKGGIVRVSTRPYFWDRRAPGQLRRRKRERRQHAQANDNCVRVDVQDSGPGIPAEDHLEVFSEFKTLSTGSKSDGVGLGLAIAKRLVDAHGGKIWVESGSESGATFSFLLETV